MQAIRSTRPGGSVGYVGVPQAASLELRSLFYTLVRIHGGPAPVRRYLPDLIELVLDGKINPGKVFDLTLPIDQVAEGYRATDLAARLGVTPARVSQARRELCRSWRAFCGDEGV